MALKSAMDEAAIAEALERLLASFPQRTAENPYIPEPVDTASPDAPPTATASP